MEQIVQQVLTIDHAQRDLLMLGQSSFDLYGFEQLKPVEWDYALPTLASGHSIKLINSFEDFVDKFHLIVPFKIRMDNLLIAGGSVSSVLIGESNMRDIDLFLYGLTPEEANVRVEQIVQDLTESYITFLKKKDKNKQKYNEYKDHEIEEKKYNFDYKYIRNTNCVTIIYDEKYVVQIILRIYQNISQILHGFDLGSSAVGFDGQRLYFTGLSKFAYEYSTNILDTTRRSTTYERRLIKYFKRNFDIILPHMNMRQFRNVNSKYKLDDVCEMPYIAFSYRGVKGNKIIISRFLTPTGNGDSDYQINDLDAYKIFYINLHHLVWEQGDYYFYSEKPGDTSIQHPYVSRRKIIDYYDDLAKKLKKGGMVNLRMLKKYVRKTDEVLKILIEQGESEKFNTLLDQCIENEKHRILNLVDSLTTNVFPLQWLTKNPGTQLTSSLNPIIEEPNCWYGNYYIEQITPSPHTIEQINTNKKKRKDKSHKTVEDEEKEKGDSEEEEDI